MEIHQRHLVNKFFPGFIVRNTDGFEEIRVIHFKTVDSLLLIYFFVMLLFK